MFRNREDAGLQLARKLKHRELHDPVVLAVPCGGLVIGAVLARELGAELDVVLSRKIRAPGQPQLALGAISEGGHVELNHFAAKVADATPHYVAREQQCQLAEIARQRQLFGEVRCPASLAGRSVVLTDDGIATGSTMLAALKAVQEHAPLEVIVAVPVASVQSARALEEVRCRCDEFVCLYEPAHFWGIEEYYADFSPVTEDQAVELLRSMRMASTAAGGARRVE